MTRLRQTATARQARDERIDEAAEEAREAAEEWFYSYESPLEERVHEYSVFRDALSRLVALAKDVTPTEQWRPIESAPIDGTWVLVWGGEWSVTMAWYALNPRIDRAYWKADDEWDDYDLADSPPTHWMPLPEPPKPEEPKP